MLGGDIAEDIDDRGGPKDDADLDRCGEGTEKGEPASPSAVVRDGSVCRASADPRLDLGGDIVCRAARVLSGSACRPSIVNWDSRGDMARESSSLSAVRAREVCRRGGGRVS